jgi:leucyl-tRNA synthetase
MLTEEEGISGGLRAEVHACIKKVTEDYERMKFNTAIAAMMEFVNAVYRAEAIGRSQAERFVLVLAPFAPHLCEELWQRLGHDGSLAYEPFPAYDAAMTVDRTVEVPVQINGKVRGRLTVAAGADEQTILDAVMADAKISGQLAGKTIVKQIVIPGRLVNLVVK